jgi:hypothetical protein
MKKLFILLAICAAMTCTTSCRWIHETFYSVEGCEEWYLDEIYDAALEGDEEKVSERQKQLEEWYNDLDASDKRKADKAALQWLESHPLAANMIYSAATDYYDYDYGY